MANFSFVIDSNFRPFSMQEMLVPFAAYKEAYENADDEYTALTAASDKFKYLSETLPENSKARQLYEGYANGLRAQAEDFNKYGLSMGNRRALSGYKRRYTGEIGRLLEADTLKKAQMKEQRTLQTSDPSLILSRRADETSLDKYLDNPNLSYKSYSGALLEKQVGTRVQALAKGLTSYAQGKPLDAYTNTFIQRTGFTPQQIADAIYNPTGSEGNSKILNAIVNDAVGSSQISSWASPEALEQAYQYARQGLWQGVGATSVSMYNNYGTQLAAKTAAERSLIQERANAQIRAAQAAGGGAGNGLPGTTSPKLVPRALRSQRELNAFNKEFMGFVNDGYLVRDNKGNWFITKEGWKEFKEGNKVADTPGRPGKMLSGKDIPNIPLDGTDKHSKFYNFIVKYSPDLKRFKNPNLEIGNNTGKLNRYLNNAYTMYQEGSYDANRSTEFTRPLTDTQGKEIKKQMFAEGNTKISALEFNGNGWNEKQMDMSDLKGYIPVRTSNSKYGHSLIWEKEDDPSKIVRTQVFKGVNQRAVENSQKAINQANAINVILNAGKMPQTEEDQFGNTLYQTDENGNIIFTDVPLNEQYKAALEDEYNNALNLSDAIWGVYVTPTETKKDEYVNFGQ